jgi:TfoX/Sxy family transcriptional regulator of competence genes
MAWIKPPRGLIDIFDESLSDDPRVERRRLFGYPAAFVQGNLFGGLFQDRIFARLPGAQRATLEARYGPVEFELMPGRTMKAYAVLPDDIVADDAALAEILAQALSFTASLPPKAPKARKPRAGKA